MSRHIFLPDAGRDARIEIPVSCFLIRHPQGNVLFDTGCHPDVARDPEARWGELSRFMVPLHGPDEHVLNGLAGLGLGPDDIDVVINSHLHCDHCGCNEFFARATFIAHQAELEAAAVSTSDRNGYFRKDWDHPAYDALTGQRDLFDDDRVVLIPLPGHTPGSTGALIGLDRDGEFLLASDAISVRESFDRDIAPKNTWQAEPLLASYAEARKIESYLCKRTKKLYR
ncbi:MAG: N-acyl homoserine lactonase family protein [Pseudomonadota bacterium]